MGLLSFARYSFESVLRNSRRSLYAVIGIVIALSLIAGSWIAVDSSGIGLLRATVDNQPIDFYAFQNSWTTNTTTEAFCAQRVAVMKSVEDVVDAAPIVMMTTVNLWNLSGNVSYQPTVPYYGGINALFLSKNSSTLFHSFRINGVLPAAGSVAISKETADQLQLQVGDAITCSFSWGNYEFDVNTSMGWYNTSYANLSFPVSQIWTQEPFEKVFRDRGYWDGTGSWDSVWLQDSVDPVVFNLDDMRMVTDPLAADGYPNGISLAYYIWIDRDKVISLADVKGTVDRIEFIQHQLEKKAMFSDFTVYPSDLSYSLTNMAPQLEMMKVLFAALSLPVVALGTYLSIVGVDLGVTERRREIAILKSRGASNRQVFGSLIIESLSLGVFAGLTGLLLGVLVSRFLLDSATTFTISSTGAGSSEFADFLVSPTTIVLSVLFGVGLMLLSSYRPFKKVSRSDCAEILHHYSPIATQVEYKPKTDILFLSLSVLSILSVYLGFDAVSGHGFSWIVQLIIGILFLAGLAIFPAMPFLLSLSIVRLLTRGSHRLYAKFTWLVKPWTKDLHYIVERNIVRNPRRASNLCVIISLALAFGLFISITMESNMGYQRDVVKYEVGSDVNVQGSIRYYPEGTSVNLSRLSSLETIPGVKVCSRFVLANVQIIAYFGGFSANLALINTTSYIEAVHPGDSYFVGGGSGMLDELLHNGTVLIAEDFMKSYDLVVGDQLPAQMYFSTYFNGSWDFYSAQFPITIAGVVKGLPGLTWYNMFMDRSSLWFLNDTRLLQASYPIGAFVKTTNDADPNDVAGRVVDMFESAGLQPTSRTLVKSLAELKEDPTYAALADFLYIEYALSIAIMTIGVGLLIFVAVSDREKELASIMARGSSGGQIRKILMGESLTLMIIGLIVGAGVGILTAYLFNTLSMDQTYAAVEKRMYMTYVTGAIVVSSVVALLLASLIATSRAGKIKLAEVLRIRGG